MVSAIDVSDLSKHISSYSKLCKQVKHQENLTCCDAFLVTRNLEHFRENKEHSQINRCPFLSLYGELFTSLVFLNVQSFTVIWKSTFFFFFVFVFLVFLPALWCRLIFMWLSAACQAPLSMEFSRQYWSGWPFPSPGDLLSPGIELDFSCTGRWILYRCTNWEAQLYGDINWHLIV